MSRNVVIIGGVAAGASCAARLRRLDEQAEITLVERGPDISFATCGLPYHLGKVIPDRADLLVQTAEEFGRRFRVRVLTRTEAVAIDRAKYQVQLREVESGETQVLSYQALVLAPGAEPVRPAVPGVELPGVFTLRNIPDVDRIMAALEGGRARRAVVVGAGFIGLEVAENLVLRGVQVTLVDQAPQVLPPLDSEMAAPMAQELVSRGVELRLGAALKGVRSAEGRLAVDLGTSETFPADLVVLAAGVRPEAKLAQAAGIVLDPHGGIEVDRQMRTSDPAVFAVGDVAEVFDRSTLQSGRVQLAGPANRQGRLVADVIAGRNVRYSVQTPLTTAQPIGRNQIGRLNRLAQHEAIAPPLQSCPV